MRTTLDETNTSMAFSFVTVRRASGKPDGEELKSPAIRDANEFFGAGDADLLAAHLQVDGKDAHLLRWRDLQRANTSLLGTGQQMFPAVENGVVDGLGLDNGKPAEQCVAKSPTAVKKTAVQVALLDPIGKTRLLRDGSGLILMPAPRGVEIDFIQHNHIRVVPADQFGDLANPLLVIRNRAIPVPTRWPTPMSDVIGENR